MEKVTVHYAGWLVDGRLFDSSYARGAPAVFPLNRVIAGWSEGLQLMRPGGRFRFVIPPELGYGQRGAPPSIGPNATLVFEVELVGVG
jgi:FKBP-type peptidyl-prolyl cis-trans isomerase